MSNRIVLACALSFTLLACPKKGAGTADAAADAPDESSAPAAADDASAAADAAPAATTPVHVIPKPKVDAGPAVVDAGPPAPVEQCCCQTAPGKAEMKGQSECAKSGAKCVRANLCKH